MGETSVAPLDRLIDAAQGGGPEEQMALALHYLQEEEFGRARRWLGRAARADFAPALRELGKLAWKGLGQVMDFHQARENFTRAADMGDAAAMYLLGVLQLGSDFSAALESLLRSASAGHAAAQRQLGVLHAAHGFNNTANSLLWSAVQHGDLFAAALLARRSGDARLATFAASHGMYVRQRFEPRGETQSSTRLPDLSAAFDAPEFTLPESGVDESRHKVESLAGGSLRIFDDLLSIDECEYLMEMAAMQLRPSHTVHPQTGAPIRNEMRTSYGYSFHPTEEDFVILAIKHKLARVAGLDVRNAEPFAMLRYEPGQEYKEHFDFINPDSGEAGREIAVRGQRTTTAFFYLTDVAQGGETCFPRHDVRIAPRQGRALVFRNLTADESPDLDSLHASLPVQEGEKWIATLWFRSKAQ